VRVGRYTVPRLEQPPARLYKKGKRRNQRRETVTPAEIATTVGEAHAQAVVDWLERRSR
jgi:hypothetical protein